MGVNGKALAAACSLEKIYIHLRYCATLSAQGYLFKVLPLKTLDLVHTAKKVELVKQTTTEVGHPHSSSHTLE